MRQQRDDAVKQLENERQVNLDLRNFITQEGTELNAAKSAAEEATKNLATLQANFEQDNADAAAAVEAAEKAAQQIHDDPTIPVTVNTDSKGTVTVEHDTEAPLPAVVGEDNKPASETAAQTGDQNAAGAGLPGGDPNATAAS